MDVSNEFLKIVRKLCVSSKMSINVNCFHSALLKYTSKVTWFLSSDTPP